MLTELLAHAGGQRQSYAETGSGQLCPSGSDVKTETECRAAAQKIGKKWGGTFKREGDHPFCLLAADGRDTVFFNAHKRGGGARTDYKSVCRSGATTCKCMECGSGTNEGPFTAGSCAYSESCISNSAASGCYGLSSTGSTSGSCNCNTKAWSPSSPGATRPFHHNSHNWPKLGSHGTALQPRGHLVSQARPPARITHKRTRAHTNARTNWAQRNVECNTLLGHTTQMSDTHATCNTQVAM